MGGELVVREAATRGLINSERPRSGEDGAA
jgi:hypothetical protein